jgi:hypothetical protein
MYIREGGGTESDRQIEARARKLGQLLGRTNRWRYQCMIRQIIYR